jgi:hypothetical protein
MRMRARLFLTSLLLLSGIAAADVVSVMPPSCKRREELDPNEYRRLGRFLSLGGGYRQWLEKDCYPQRLDDPALAQIDRPVGYVVTVAGHDAFVVDLGPTWFNHCTNTSTPVSGSVAVDGSTLLALAQHLASMPSAAALDLHEIGFAEARMRDKRAIFALYLATGDRAANLECFEDLDGAVERAIGELSRPPRR